MIDLELIKKIQKNELVADGVLKTISLHIPPEIILYDLSLTKDSHTSEFLKNLKEKLAGEQKELILRQAESRLDEDLNFFLRFDKEKLINEDKLWITDSGNCFHIKISIAAFPKRRENGLEIVKMMFN